MITDQTWTGAALTPAPTVRLGSYTLRAGVDYTVSYANNTDVGTATVTVCGEGNWVGRKSTTFKVVAPTAFFVDADPTDGGNHGVEVNWMGCEGISTGWPDKGKDTLSFRPMAHVARQDMAAFMYRLNGRLDPAA